MNTSIKILLTELEMKSLLKQAALDCRRPQEQARYILRSALFSDNRIDSEKLSQKTNSDVTTRQSPHVAVTA